MEEISITLMRHYLLGSDVFTNGNLKYEIVNGWLEQNFYFLFDKEIEKNDNYYHHMEMFSIIMKLIPEN